MMITDNDDKMISFKYTKASESETKAKNLKIILVETKQPSSYRPKLFWLFLGFTITTFISALTTSLSTS